REYDARMTEAQPVAAKRAPAGERRTISRLWTDAVARGWEGPAYLVQGESGWAPVSGDDAAERVEAYANRRLARRIRKGEAAGILAATRLEWTLFAFALAQIGAVTAPVYASNSARDAAYVLAHAEAVAVLAENDDQLAKIEAHRDELSHLRDVLTFA